MVKVEEKINYWFFSTPKICFGNKSLNYLEDIPGNRIFIVSDEFVAKNLLHHVTDKLKALKKDFTIFSEVQPDPKEEMVLKGAQKCREYGPDLIIAVGGGSPIDAAKAIWILYERPELEIDDMHLFLKLGLGKKAELVAIPTTSGTGAETTWAMVITRTREDGSEIKLELANKEAIPTYAILDPVFTIGLPPQITCHTGMDALAHITEALISKVSNDFSEGLALKGFELIKTYLPIAYKNGKDVRAREAVHNAACIAGLSFGNAQIILGHSLGHSLGATFHKPHGLCVGTVMIPVLQYMANNPDLEQAKKTKEKLSLFAKKLGIAKWDDPIDIGMNKFYDALRELMKLVDFPSSIKEWGIERSDFNSKIKQATELVFESTSYVFGPRPVTYDNVIKILEYTFEGKDIDF